MLCSSCQSKWQQNKRISSNEDIVFFYGHTSNGCRKTRKIKVVQRRRHLRRHSSILFGSWLHLSSLEFLSRSHCQSMKSHQTYRSECRESNHRSQSCLSRPCFLFLLRSFEDLFSQTVARHKSMKATNCACLRSSHPFLLRDDFLGSALFFILRLRLDLGKADYFFVILRTSDGDGKATRPDAHARLHKWSSTAVVFSSSRSDQFSVYAQPSSFSFFFRRRRLSSSDNETNLDDHEWTRYRLYTCRERKRSLTFGCFWRG